MFACKNLAVERNGQRVLSDVDFRLDSGAIVALTGPNGCGKTTFLEAIAGAIPIAAGSVEFLGERVETLPTFARARRGIRLICDRHMVFPNLSVGENLSLRASSDERSGAPLDVASFHAFRSNQKAGSLSGGEKRIVATLATLQSAPRLLLADEFSEGLQQGVVQKMLAAVRALCGQGSSAILVVHSERFARDEGIPALTIERGKLRTL